MSGQLLKVPLLQFALLLLTTLCLLTPGGTVAQPVSDSVGRVVEVEVPAPALAGNLLDTPTVQGAAVYLPPSYDGEPDRRYPAVFLLHGIFDDYEVWLEHFDVPALLDRLIDAGEIPELVMVMPNGGNRYGGGFYRNSPVSGRWADYIVEDLVGFIDQHFRTLAVAEGRAVVGHSMGGYGALHLAMTRPGVFSTVWALSPCCLAATDDLSFGNDAWKRSAAVTSAGDIEALIENRDFYAIAGLGVVTAFSPDPSQPPIHGDFSFDIVRGEVVLDDAAYDLFLDAMPLRQVHDAREALRDLRGLGLGVGLGDQFLHIPTGTLAFSQRLGAERIPHVLDVYDGDHRQHVEERLERIILPWVGDRLAVAE
jgi:S-formylglutathione hydrolase FrmB